MSSPRLDPSVFRTLTAIDEAFDAGAGVVVLHGPPGVGKTHTATAWMASRDPLVIEVSEATGPDEVERRIAEAVGAPRATFADGSLTTALQAADAACVVVDGAAHQLEGILDRIEGVTARMRWLVASTRHPGERAIAVTVAPLSTEGEESEAARFLLQRCRRFRAGYRPDCDELHALDDVARHLDGLPLALEIAAPRVVLAGARRFQDRLAHEHGALGKAWSPLRAAIDGAWQNLEPAAQRALRSATLFRGAFDLEAAEAVLDMEAGGDPLDLLQGLYERSMLRASDDGRFRLSWSVREYLREAQPPSEDARERFVTYFATLAERESRRLLGPEAREAWAALGAERDNVWAVAAGGHGSASAAAAAALGPLVLASGPLLPYVELVERLDAEPGEDLDRARLHAAEALALAGLPERAEEALEFAAQSPWVEADKARVRCKLALLRGDPEGAAATARAALEEDVREPGSLLLVLAAALGPLGDLRGCLDALQRALADFRARGEMRQEGVTLAYLGNVYADLDREADARLSLAQAQAIAEVVDDRFVIAFAEANFGLLAHRKAQLEAAIGHYDRAIAQFRRLAARWYEGGYLGYRHTASHQAGGDADEALGGLREACAIVAADDRFSGYFQSYMARITAGRGAVETARRLFDEARDRLDAAGDRDLLRVFASHRVAVSDVLGPAPADLVELAREAETSHATDVRTALATRVDAPTPELPDPARAVVIADDGMSFTTADGTDVDLSERDLLGRALGVLVDAAREAPDELVPREQLIARIWPGERIVPRAALNRLRVTVASLRKLGLDEVLLTRRGGYLLDPRAVSGCAAPASE